MRSSWRNGCISSGLSDNKASSNSLNKKIKFHFFIIYNLPLDENQRVEKHHKKSEHIKIYKELASCFVKLLKKK